MQYSVFDRICSKKHATIGADPWGVSKFDLCSVQFCSRSEGNGAFGFDFNVMLQQFSWGHFLVASIVLNLVWYGFVLLVFFRKEVLAFLGSEEGSSALTSVPNPTGTTKSQFQNVPASGAEKVEEVSLMGSSKLPEGVEVLSSSQVSFSGGDLGDKYEQVGLVADVVQVLKIIFSELERTAGDKRDFFRLLAKVKEEYGPLYGHPSLGAINEFIAGRAGFHVTPEEMENLWY